MKTLTIKQPYASLIAEGYKEYEFRSWKTSFRGEIYIHAGKTVDKEAMEYFKDYHLNCPLGCIIAKAKVIDCVKTDDEFCKKQLEKDPKVYHNLLKKKEKRYGFHLADVKKIKPISAKGKLSFWEYQETEERI